MLGRIENNPIAATQCWMEDFIIEKGVCPPFVRIAKNYRRDDGRIDWDRFSQETAVEDATSLSSDPTILIPFLSSKYINFVTGAYQGGSPMSLNIILPDFAKNSDYEYTIRDTKHHVIDELTSSPEMKAFTTDVALALVQKQYPDAGDLSGLRELPPFILARLLVEDGFRFIYFHGQPLTDEELEEYDTDEGPLDRHRMFVRAPYYMLQFINSFRAVELVAPLHMETVYQHNNALLERMGVPAFEEFIADVRKD